MFKDDYKAAFSKVTASGETYRRVMQMTQKNNQKRRCVSGTVSKLLIAAIVVSLLAVTAAATVQNWFVPYFSGKSESGLSQEQVEFIEERAQDIGQSQTCDGYTIEVKSVLSDGRNAYFVFGITAPEDVYLDRTVKEGFDPAAPVLWTEVSFLASDDLGYGATWSMQDDGDGLANTHNLVYLVSSDGPAFENGSTCQVHFENLTAEYTNAAYASELEQTYGYLPKLGELTLEESGKLYPTETLAEGNWDFEFTFAKSDVPVVELIDEPVEYVLEFDTPEETVVQKTRVLSVRLSPIGTVCTFEGGTDAPGSIGGEIYMKDGSSVSLGGDAVGGSSDNSSWGMFSVPISLEEIDYIQFPDGTKLPMPEEPAQ